MAIFRHPREIINGFLSRVVKNLDCQGVGDIIICIKCQADISALC